MQQFCVIFVFFPLSHSQKLIKAFGQNVFLKTVLFGAV